MRRRRGAGNTSGFFNFFFFRHHCSAAARPVIVRVRSLGRENETEIERVTETENKFVDLAANR